MPPYIYILDSMKLFHLFVIIQYELRHLQNVRSPKQF